MTGREEHNLKIETRILAKLKNDPEILTKFYYSLTDDTPKTKEVYTNYVRDFLNYIGKNYITAKTSDMNQYLDSLKYYTDRKGETKLASASIKRARMAAVKRFYNFLIDEEMIDRNPCDKVRLPSNNKEIQVTAMTPLEIQNVKENMMMDEQIDSHWKNRNMAIFTLGCNTGLRISSIVQINMEDLDFEENSVRVIEKGNKERTVFFGENTASTLKAWIEDREQLGYKNTGALFVGKRSPRINPKIVADVLAKYTKGLDKHITPHKMRSSCATNLYEQTGDIYLVQNVLGHANIENTKRYAKLSEERRKNAAEILDHIG